MNSTSLHGTIIPLDPFFNFPSAFGEAAQRAEVNC